MRLSARGCDEAGTIAAHGHRAAASDVGTAMTLLRAGLHGAGLNVEINLGSVSDPSYVHTAREEAARLAEQSARATKEADAVLRAG
jgi:formiminotetrahydrofolate cyclodeaminase